MLNKNNQEEKIIKKLFNAAMAQQQIINNLVAKKLNKVATIPFTGTNITEKVRELLNQITHNDPYPYEILDAISTKQDIYVELRLPRNVDETKPFLDFLSKLKMAISNEYKISLDNINILKSKIDPQIP